MFGPPCLCKQVFKILETPLNIFHSCTTYVVLKFPVLSQLSRSPFLLVAVCLGYSVQRICH